MNKLKIDKIMYAWLLIFLVLSFILEKFWNEFTIEIAFYACLINSIVMIVVRIIYEIVKRIKNK